MEIKTKFALGDRLFVLFDNKVYQVDVTCVEVSFDNHGLSVNYKIRFPSGGENRVCEARLFKSKQDLLRSL